MKASIDQHDTTRIRRNDAVSLGQEVSRLQESLAACEAQRAQHQKDIARVCGERDAAQAGAAAMREALEDIAEDPGCGCTPCMGACQTEDTLRDELAEIRGQAHAALQSPAGRALLERLERAEGRVRVLDSVVSAARERGWLQAEDEPETIPAFVRNLADARDEAQGTVTRINDALYLAAGSPMIPQLRSPVENARVLLERLARLEEEADTARVAVADLATARAELAALRAVPEGTEPWLVAETVRWQQIADSYQSTSPGCDSAVSAARLAAWLRELARLRKVLRGYQAAEQIWPSPSADTGWTHVPLGRPASTPAPSADAGAGSEPTRYPADLAVPSLTEAATVAAAAVLPSEPNPALRQDVQRAWASRYGTVGQPVRVCEPVDMTPGSRAVPAGCCPACLGKTHRQGCREGAPIVPDAPRPKVAAAVETTTAQEATR